MSDAAREVPSPTVAAESGPITWHVDDRPWVPLTGLFINRSGYKTLTDAAYTGNAYSIELTSVGPGGSSPTHVEPHAHLFYVLSGRGEVTVGDEVKDVKAGSVSPISAGVPHSFRNLGEDALEMLVVYHPPRVRKPVASDRLNATVCAIHREARGIVSIELTPQANEAFPPFDVGSHIDLHLPDGMVRSYSLCNSPGETGRYVVGVYRVPESRGGSRYIHDGLRVGSTIEISKPRNNFPLHEDAAHSVLIAGGIGITPILGMVRRLMALGRPVELLYCARSRSDAAFVKQIEAFGLPVTWHFNDEHGDRVDLRHFLASRPADAHFYACGPASMLDDFERLCAELGREHAHVERFVARDLPATQQSSYEVELRRTGRKLAVTPAKSLLQTLLDEGIEVAHGCTQGLCGACKTRVLEGEPDHRDSVLTSAERASHAVMTVCVSGCKSGTLVLDL
ncbi:cupin domain-containing protein [Paraburkholderia sp. Ac-20336]|nr:cupin domain-containing protein [Paraburkholderia sp. Ac-20336]